MFKNIHKQILKKIKEYDEIVICGFAKDICVANTVKDMIDSGLYEGKLRIFEEGMASIDENSPMMEVFNGLQSI